MGLKKSNISYLLIKKAKKMIGNVLKFLVNGTNDGGNGTLDGSNGGSQRPGVLFRVIVKIRHTNQRVDRSHPHEG